MYILPSTEHICLMYNFKTIYAYIVALDIWFFYMHQPTDSIAHTTAFVTPVVEHWLEREIAQWVHHEGSIRRWSI